MNQIAEQHLAKARDYVSRGEEFYRKAAEEIVAAQEADPTLSNRDIGQRLGKSREYVRRLVTAHTNSTRASGGEFKVDWQSGSNVRSEVAQRVLQGATPEEIEDLMADLQPEAVERIAAAAHKSQIDAARGESTTTRSVLTDSDYGDAAHRIEAVRNGSTIEMAELFTALSRVRVKGVERLVANAGMAERRQWVERLPDEIALLQLAFDLCKTHKLQAVQ